MEIRVICGTTGSGTDADPFRPYVADLWSLWSAVDRREGELPWLVILHRPDDMSSEDYDSAVAALLEDPGIELVEESA